jgi:hypothetical protein
MRKFSTFVFVAFAAALAFPTTGAAQSQPVAFQLNPSEGPAGTDFAAQGALCSGGEGTPTVVVKVYDLDGTTVLDEASASAAQGGAWTTGAVLEVPADKPVGAYPVKAACSNPEVVYTDQAFNVTPPAPVRTALPAVVRGNQWFMRNTLSSGTADATFSYGDPGDEPIICDWDGNGVATVAVRRGFTFYLRNTNSAGVADVVIPFGNVGDIATCGDWDDDGDEEIGVVRGNQWFLRNNSTPGDPSTHPAFFYGDPGDQPKVGDWDGNGSATPGVRRGNVWYLKNNLQSGAATLPPITFGDPTDVPLVGDWNNDNTETVGVFRNGQWFFKNTLNSGVADVPPVSYGSPGDRPRVWFSED